MATVKKTQYIVQLAITSGSFHITVDAATLEEALTIARNMKDYDKLAMIEDWNDYNLEITGVFK
jgi:hypothetical protein